MDSEILLAGAVRTPIGKFGGKLATQTAVDLGSHAARTALKRAGIDAKQVDQAIFGHGRQAGNGTNPGRQVALRAGLPVESPAFTINQACLSGMQAIFAAMRAIRLGEAEVVLVGGMESMSRVPYLLEARFGFRMGHQPLVDAMYRDGFTDPITGQVMGQTAETLAKKYEISRDEQDDFAARSQSRYQSAFAAGHFKDEVAPIEVPSRDGSEVVDRDEHPRHDVTPERLGGLRPVFDSRGTVTAGNSSGITDGAAAMVVLGSSAAARLGVEPMVRVAGYRVDGVAPEIMGIGPVPAVRNLLRQTGRSLDEIDLIELNEAFAAQALAVDRELRFDPERLNVNGGAIALGHPIGCTGARIVVTLLHEMARRRSGRGLATLCVSGGLGGALLVERP